MFYSMSLLAILMTVGISMNYSTPSIKEMNEVSHELNEMKPKKNVIKINGLNGKYTVNVGDKLEYTASVHGSVGFTCEVASSDEDGLPKIDQYIKYDNKKSAKMPGGDSAVKYFIFEVKKAGNYVIHAKHYFRGDVEHDFAIEITVE